MAPLVNPRLGVGSPSLANVQFSVPPFSRIEIQA